MNGFDKRPTAAMAGFDTYDNDAAATTIDDEFGALQMFDSTAFSSQANNTAFNSNGQASVAVMDGPPAQSTEKRSKRDKKEKKDKKKKATDTSSLIIDEAGTKQQEDPKQGATEDDIDTLAAAAEPLTLNEDPVAALTATQKKKRKHAEAASAEAKKRKKRKSRDNSVDDASAQLLAESQAQQDEATDSVRKDKLSQTSSANMKSGEAKESEPHKSSTTARPPKDVAKPGEGAGREVNIDVVETIAREAWNEHVSGIAQDGNRTAENADVEMVDAAKPHETKSAAENNEALENTTETTPARRSTRPRKAKRTGAEETSKDAENDTSEGAPADTIPKPGKRAKPVAKRTRARSPKRSQNLSAGDEEDHVSGDEAYADQAVEDAPGGDMPRSRRNRMAGFVQGRFTDDELERISKAIAAFGVENNLTQREVNDMIHTAGGSTAGEAHAQLWARLFAECPDRHRQKVINTTRKRFHNFVARGTWTTEQDQEFRDLIEVHGTKWSHIAGLVNRHPEDLRDRYRNYIVCGDKQRKDSWDEAEEAQLKQYVLEASEAIDELRHQQPSRALLQKTYEELIDWQGISERMGRTRSRLQCITKWKSLLQRDAKEKTGSLAPDAELKFNLDRARRQLTDMPEPERQRVLLAINETNVSSDDDIPWEKLVDESFRGEWHTHTQQLIWHRLKKTVPDWKTMSTRDCAAHLVQQFHQTGDLPDIDGDDFDDAKEGQCIKGMAGPSASKRKAQSRKKQKAKGEVSEELVHDSDTAANGAGSHVAAQAKADSANDDTMQIDPELMQASMPDAGVPAKAPTAAPAEVPPADVPAKEATMDVTLIEEPSLSNKKTTKTATKQSTNGKKRGSGKKGLMLSQDPIDDGEPEPVKNVELPDIPESQMIESPKPKKKRASAKEKGLSKGKKRAVTPEKAPAAVSSDMDDDMEDVPAKLPA